MIKPVDGPASAVEALVDRAVAAALSSGEDPPQSLPLPVDRMAVVDADGNARFVDVLA